MTRQNAKESLQKASQRFRCAIMPSNEYRHKLVCNQSEVRIHDLFSMEETAPVSFRWDSVMAVDTYKRDLLTVDCVCLAFETPDGWIEVNEDMKGWDAFLDAVKSSLPGFPSRAQWLEKVTKPAFETNHSRLWSRGDGSTAQ